MAALGGFCAAGSARAQTQNVVISQTTQIDSITWPGVTFNATNQNVDLIQSPGSTLTLQTGSISKIGPFNSALTGGNVVTGSTGFNISVSDGTLSIASALVGQGKSLTLSGLGTLVLTNTSVNQNFNGGINILGGTLRIFDDRNLGGNSGNNNFVVLNGGTFEIGKTLSFSSPHYLAVGSNGGQLLLSNGDLGLLGDNQLRGSGTLTKAGPGTLVIGNANNFTGAINVTGGALELRNTFGISSRSLIGLGAGASLNLRNDAANAVFGNDVTVGSSANGGPTTIDISALNGTGGGQFHLGGLAIASGGILNLSNAAGDGSVMHFDGAANIVGSSTINTVGKAPVWLDGQVLGRGALTKTGSGILYIAGDVSNTNPSLTTVSAGALRLFKSADGLTAIAGDVLVNGGVLQLDQANQIADTSTINLDGGAFRVNGRAERVSFLTNTAGQLTTGVKGQLRLTGGGLLGAPPADLLAGPLPAVPPASLVITGGTTTVNAGGLLEAFSAQISGGVNTVQAADGVFSILSGGLTFTGTASPNVSLGADDAGPGQLKLAGNLTSNNTAGTASITTTGPGAKAGFIDLQGASRTVTVSDGSAAVDLLVAADLTNGSIAKSGAGTLRLEGNNALTNLTLNSGSVEVKGAGALGSTPLVLNAGTLRVRSDSAVTTFTGPLTAADSTIDVDRDTVAGPASGVVEFGSLSIGASRLIVVGANNRSVRLTGPVTLTGAAVFEAGGPLTVSGVIGGAYGLTKEGTGTMTIDGGVANAFTGSTRVNVGTLELNKTTGNAVPGAMQIFGGTARLLRPNQIADTSNVQVENAGSVFDVNGQVETIGSLNGVGTQGSVTLGTGGVLTVTQGTFNGVISGAGMLVQENIAGGTSAAVVLGNTQTFTGGVLVNHGSVTFNNQAPQHAGATLNGGTWGAYNGSSLNFNAGSSITTSLANVTISGATSSFNKINGLTNNQGTFTITGGKTFATVGALTNSGTLTVGPASQITLNGTFTNTGVTTTTGTLATTGAITTSGTLTVSGPQSHGASSSLTVTGGTATLNTDAGSPAVYNLAVSATGGALAFTATQHLKSLNLDAPVSLGAALAADLPEPAPATIVATGSKVLVTKTLTTTGKGKLDLTNNALIVDYGGAPGAAFTTVRDAVISGYAGGTWTGFGIVSSTAAANAGYAVGFAEASEALAISGTSTATFRGETVDATAVLARFTVQGDSNLDGAVNFNDLLALARNYNLSGKSWVHGDFDYNGTVNFNDLLALARNYNTILPAEALPGASAEFTADVAMVRAGAAVPEPSGLAAVVAAAACATVGRRRRAAPPRPTC